MKPKKHDTLRGTASSVLLHAVILAALLFSWHSVKQSDSAGGDAGIEASMVKFGDLPAQTQAAITGAPQPLAGEPMPTPVETPPEVIEPEVMPTPVQDTVEETLPQPTPEPVAKKPAPETRPQPKPIPTKPVVTKPADKKIEKPVTPQPTTQPTGAAKARADAMARMRAEQLKDITGGSTATTAGNPKGQSSTGTKSSVGKGEASGNSTGNQKRWLDAVAKAIERQWIRPDGIPNDQACPIRIRIIPGGEVISANVQSSCPYSASAKQSVQDAVMKASPLPFKGFENDYARDFTVNFYPSK
ncbi:hypothetical protein G7069_01045 [Lysobacter sp. HDW10]|uniref:TonB C-terminal domain-containing protein n=1 Tax=Lysobacter sp. HDW10 TaxID=2714936 RepID=UPI0014076590|nr:TonB C-terminal domain-containing protein [Lysobacter sp. HDW10]QIK80308.1 hypothetical protein G7069_01045 [Lysobacter sp. HDW10]